MRACLMSTEALKALAHSPRRPRGCQVTREAEASGKLVPCRPQSHRTSLPRILPLRNVRSPLLRRPSRGPQLASHLAVARTHPSTNRLPAATERAQEEDSEQHRALPVRPEVPPETLPPDLCPSRHPLPLPLCLPPF